MSQPKKSSKRVRGRQWCFTLNNPEMSPEELGTKLEKAGAEFVFQQEQGADENTPHVQGYMRFKSQRDFDVVKKLLPRAHIEKAKGTFKQNVAYCTKKETRVEGPWTNLSEEFMPEEEVIDPLQGKELRPWQEHLWGILEEPCEPGDRTIYWYWEDAGNVGKTTFAKHVCLQSKRVLYTGGKASDVKYGIASMKHKPKIVLWDVMRSQEQYLSYQGIEEVKNGIFYSGKYESGMVMYNVPHVVIFANFPPDRSKLSGDRWSVWRIPSASGEPVEEQQPVY